MKKTLSVLVLLVASVCAMAQMADPVHFTSKMTMLGGDEAQIEFSAKIDNGWHVYSTGLGNDGPISATFNASKMDGVKTVGGLTHKGKEISQFDNMFGMKLRYFEGSVTFIQKIKFTKPQYSINCYLEYGACNDETCMPPTSVDFIKSGNAPAVAKDAAADKADNAAAANAAATTSAAGAPAEEGATVSGDSVAASMNVAAPDSATTASLWQPVISDLKAYEAAPTDSSLFDIFLAGFAGGFLALLTPCV